MILELRTYTVRPGTAPQTIERFAAGLPARTKVSPLAGFFQAEAGPLNQLLLLWPYANLAERERLRDVKVEGWPPNIREFLVELEVKILNPAPFSPPVEPREFGNLWEIRTYTYAPGSIPHVVKAWGEKIAGRQRFSPLAFAGSTEFGQQNLWVHIWPYKDWNDRTRARDEAAKSGAWPARPGPEAVILRQQNQFVSPTAQSPWR